MNIIKRAACAFIAITVVSGCATMSSTLKDKSSGVPVVYETDSETAWRLSKNVLMTEGGAESVNENRDDGYISASSGAGGGTWGTFMVAWIDPESKGRTKVTVLTKRRLATTVSTTLTEDSFHTRFAESLKTKKAKGL